MFSFQSAQKNEGSFSKNYYQYKIARENKIFIAKSIIPIFVSRAEDLLKSILIGFLRDIKSRLREYNKKKITSNVRDE